jgi:hypothetical protein
MAFSNRSILLNIATLVQGMADEKSPCEIYECEFRDRCSAERLACSSFVDFVNVEGVAPAPPYDIPTRKKYEGVFTDDR